MSIELILIAGFLSTHSYLKIMLYNQLFSQPTTPNFIRLSFANTATDARWLTHCSTQCSPPSAWTLRRQQPRYSPRRPLLRVKTTSHSTMTARCATCTTTAVTSRCARLPTGAATCPLLASTTLPTLSATRCRSYNTHPSSRKEPLICLI